MLKILYSKIPPSFDQEEIFRLFHDGNGQRTRLLSHYEAKHFSGLYARLMLLYSLDRFWNIKDTDLVYFHHQKPYFLNYPELFFNISHSQDIILTAFSDTEIGVDIQFTKNKRDLPLKRNDKVLCENEIDTLRTYKSEIRDREYLRCWTRKEAFCKCLGEGLSLYSRFNFDSMKTTELYYADNCYHFYEKIVEDDYILSVCTENKNETLHICEIAPSLILDFYRQLKYNKISAQPGS